MNLFSQLRKPFVFSALTLALMLSSAFLPPRTGDASSIACPLYAKEIRYYSDASYSYQVGTGYIYCNGSSTLDGTSTPYRQEDILDVCCRDPGNNACVPC